MKNLKWLQRYFRDSFDGVLFAKDILIGLVVVMKVASSNKPFGTHQKGTDLTKYRVQIWTKYA